MEGSVSAKLICYSNEIMNGEPLLISSNGLPIKALNFEPAGHAFHRAVLRLLGYFEEEAVNDCTERFDDDKNDTHISSSDSYNAKARKKFGGGGKQHDHYALLGLSHLRYLATEEQIRKSYRETALKYHPDKQAALLLAETTEAAKLAKKEEIETHFKSIQESYEVLIDPVKRRIYDSTDEFDDAIPAECATKDFFKVFGPAFMRNGRWSVIQPAPLLGDDDTPMEEVDRFYDFWYSFKSWREFPHADEFDVELAESRDHKRWMERQNAKLTEKARKEEYARIRCLVDCAHKRDPRILRRKEELKVEKQKKKESKFMAKKLQAEEAARIAEEERRQKEEEDRSVAEATSRQKKLKEKEKKLLRKERSRLRTLASHVTSQRLLDLSEDDLQHLCISFEFEPLRDLCDKIEGKDGLEQARLLQEAHHFNQNMIIGKQGEKNPPPKNGHVEANGSVLLSRHERKERPWGKVEIELLRKGVQKYPKGTSRRWEVISEYISTGRSVEDILKATKTVLLQKPDSSKAFDSFLEKRKPAQTIPSPLSTRDEMGGVPIPLRDMPEMNMGSTDNVQSSSSCMGHQEPDDMAMPDGMPCKDSDSWSEVQERALVQALKTFPKETSQRWERVATAVPGKTVSQCKKRFASLKDSFRSKKNAV